MDYAVIEVSGRQFWVYPKQFCYINYLPVWSGTKICLKKVLLIRKNKEIKLGFPHVLNASVQALVLYHLLDRKCIVYKMKPKKKYRRKNGHRQTLTKLRINSFKFK
uniref:ribosomal protein L21 n=1 Tax=Haramonas pauciplastida TaxID=478668 RepID=UPI0021140978|nr:ribosomal protein L21 [Haramonas pauciplastida]YP_010444182.1 ribosomal protein L21 [Haramonas pauciplastida]UTE95030.1 ribosomal protein L21 [Haramonas pauciplastida]UTE95068.1 ribosomal protein L21 [Haramonas pauciplastida]